MTQAPGVPANPDAPVWDHHGPLGCYPRRRRHHPALAEIRSPSRLKATLSWPTCSLSQDNAQYAEIDEYEGGFAIIYSRSLFLDLVSKGTFATHDHPGPFVHYGFSILNHLVDVVACEPPSITRSLVEEAREMPGHANWMRVRDEPTQ